MAIKSIELKDLPLRRRVLSCQYNDIFIDLSCMVISNRYKNK